MIDLPFYPLPDDTDAGILAQLGLVYKAKHLVLGTESDGDLAFTSDKVTQLSNLVIKTLLTTKGSVPTRPQEGTNLNALLRHGYDPSKLTEDIALILLDAENQIKNLQSTQTTSLEATLESIELSEVQLITSTDLIISINIASASGSVITFDLKL
tara:strand:+ start:943 stop:1407 length:465 start_codon:yes stop_codon:yes gene_type:complete